MTAHKNKYKAAVISPEKDDDQGDLAKVRKIRTDFPVRRNFQMSPSKPADVRKHACAGENGEGMQFLKMLPGKRGMPRLFHGPVCHHCQKRIKNTVFFSCLIPTPDMKLKTF